MLLDTEFAMNVCVIEEELEVEKLNEQLKKQAERNERELAEAIAANMPASSSSDPANTFAQAMDVDASGANAALLGGGSNTAGGSSSSSSAPNNMNALDANAAAAAGVERPEQAELVMNKIELAGLYSSASNNSMNQLLEKLRGVAKFRTLLKEYVAKLRQQSLEGKVWLDATQKGIREVVEYEMLDKGVGSYPLRSARLLALKMWEREGGASELQLAMARNPLSDVTQWFQQWRNDGTATEMNQFLGGSKLPSWNPFHDFNEDTMDVFQQADNLLSAFALHQNAQEIKQYFMSIQSKMVDDQRKIMGGFILRFAMEGLQKAVVDQPPTWVSQLQERIASRAQNVDQNAVNNSGVPVADANAIFSPQLGAAFPRGYISVIQYFSADPRIEDLYKRKIAQNTDYWEAWPYWSMKLESTPEQISQNRFLAQLFVTIWSAQKNSILYFFRQLMEDPSEFGKHYLPGMEIDIREICTSAMGDYKVDFSRFCVCPNGHPYYIADCGQAFTKAKCAECGEEIGGGGHQLLQNNKRMQKEDQAPPGYTHRYEPGSIDPVTGKVKGSAKSQYTQKRALVTPSYVCITRLLTHGAMFLGMVLKSQEFAQANPKPPAYFKNIVNKEYCQNVVSTEKEMEWIAHQFKSDWKILPDLLSTNPEEVCKILHILLDRLHKRPIHCNVDSVDGDEAKVEEVEEARKQELTSGSTEVGWGMPYDRNKRLTWEEVLVKGYLEELVPSNGIRQNEIVDANTRWKNQDGPFLIELKERYDLGSLTMDKREAEENLLWSYRGGSTLELLQQRVTVKQPILSVLFKFHEKFECLQHLSDVLQFQLFLITRYSHRRSRSEVQELTIRQMFAELSVSEPPDVIENAEKYFAGFAAAWNSGFGNWISAWECLDIPTEYLGIRMTRDTALVFCLPNPTNEGICPLALTQSMVEAHNGFMGQIRKVETEQVKTNYYSNKLLKIENKEKNLHDAMFEDQMDDEENIKELLKDIENKQISTRDLTNKSDCLNFSLEELLALVQDRATTFEQGGLLQFDLDKVELFLLDHFRNIPTLQLELKCIRFHRDKLEDASTLTATVSSKYLILDKFAFSKIGSIGTLLILNCAAKASEQVDGDSTSNLFWMTILKVSQIFPIT